MGVIDYTLICKALADSNRLQIVELLSEGEMCGCRILERFNITQPTLSHHMRILCESKLVSIRKDGKWCYYSLNEETLDKFGEFVTELSANNRRNKEEAQKKIHIRTGYCDIENVKQIFREYKELPGAEACFVSFEKELDHLETIYSLPKGRIYLAYLADKVVGCIALKPLDENCCEIKRLYVKPEYRGSGIGRALLEKVINAAKEEKYQKIQLETLEGIMDSAIRMYQNYGFKTVQKNGNRLVMERNTNHTL